MILENPQLSYLEVPEAQRIEFTGHPLRFRRQQFLVAGLFFLGLLIAPLILLGAGNWLFALLLAIGVFVVAVIGFVSVHKSFKVRGYALRRHDISYRKGWIFYSVLTIPFNRIQHSELSEGPIDRLFNLSKLKIYTAGGSGADLTIPGLDVEDAQKLREFIAKEAAEHE